jgi:hypothetical protein
MLFEAVPIYVDGVRMSRSDIEAAPRVLGNLLIADMEQPNHFGRQIRYAVFMEPVPAAGFPTRQIPPRLFNPVLTQMRDQ